MMKNFTKKSVFMMLLLWLTPLAFNGLYAQDWAEIIRIAASDVAGWDEYGTSVDVDGDYAIVGVPNEDEDSNGLNTMSGAGSAYILRKTDGSWVEVQKIVPSDRAFGDFFGLSVAIRGNYAIVGARSEDEDADNLNTMGGAGSAYIFKNNAGTWEEVQKIVASDRASSDSFGHTVGINSDFAFVGAIGEDEDAEGANTMNSSGSVYVFNRNVDTWSQVQKIVASNRSQYTNFGYSLSLKDDIAIIGAFGANSAYIISNNEGVWEEEEVLTVVDLASNSWLGCSVDIDGDFAILGAYGVSTDTDGQNSITGSGAAYFFSKTNGTWEYNQKIVASDRSEEKGFGYDVAIRDSVAIIGSYASSGGLTDYSENYKGAAYVFENSSNGWMENEIIVPDDAVFQDDFGRQVAFDGYALIASAPRHDEVVDEDNSLNNSGCVYIYDAPRESRTLYVNLAASGNNDGSTWDNAYTSLQDALVTARENDSIWIAKGTYHPSQSFDGFTDVQRLFTFTLPAGVNIFGGFSGTETDLNQRANYSAGEANETILSGDFNNDDASGNVSENAIYVFSDTDGSKASDLSLIDGAFVTGGNENGIIIYVDLNASAANDGTSWGNAFTSLQGALDVALGVDEIWLTKGIYAPTQEVDGTTDDKRQYTFAIPDGVKLYGGFVGNESSIAERTDYAEGEANATILSGDVDMNDAEGNIFENARYVLSDASGNELTDLSNVDVSSVEGSNSKKIIPVNPNASGNNDGTSWANAFTSLHLALEVSEVDEIWLTNGSYTPTQEADGSTDDTRQYTFAIPDGVKLYGGFVGDESSIEERTDYAEGEANATILSGDIDLNDAEGNIFENARWVLSDAYGDELTDFSNIEVSSIEGNNPNDIFPVDVNAIGNNDGTSWDNAFTNLQDAIDTAISGAQIWVAKGTYLPTEEVDGTTDTEREFAFKLADSVKIYGGFAGNESSPDERMDYGRGGVNETILSGDFNDDDVVTGSGSTLSLTNYTDNAYHVIYNPEGHTVTSTALLDGFTIRGGYANGSANPWNDGAGMYNVDGQTPVVNNCYFYANYAKDNAGGLYFVDLAEQGTFVTNCVFSHNRATDNGGAFAIFSASNITDTLTLVNTLMYGNRAGINGGAIITTKNRIKLLNNTIADNYAGNSGGGVHNITNSKAAFVNTILWGNAIGSGYGPQVRNFDNGDSYYLNCAIESGMDGVATKSDGSSETDEGGLVSDDPLFVGDSISTTYPYLLFENSPCINAGLNSKVSTSWDLRGQGFDRIQADIVDVGVFEFQVFTCSLEVTIIQDGNKLYSDAQDGDFQWFLVNGEEYSGIMGATDSVFNVESPGTYALELTQGECKDTSELVTIVATRLETELLNMVKVYPNPTSGDLTLELGQEAAVVRLNVRDLTGRTVLAESYYKTNKVKLNLGVPSGTYILEIVADDARTVEVLQKK